MNAHAHAVTDSDQILTTDQAAQYLRVSRRTIQRIAGDADGDSYVLKRTRLSPGRVGFRLSDVLAYARGRQALGLEVCDIYHPGNCELLPRQVGVELRVDADNLQHRFGVGGRHWRIGICKASPDDEPVEVTLRLCPAVRAAQEIQVVDVDGIADVAPIRILPTEGERILGARGVWITKAYGIATLQPIIFDPGSEMLDAWLVG